MTVSTKFRDPFWLPSSAVMAFGRNMLIGSVGGPFDVGLRVENQAPTAGSKKTRRHISTRGKRDSMGSASARTLVTSVDEVRMASVAGGNALASAGGGDGKRALR